MRFNNVWIRQKDFRFPNKACPTYFLTETKNLQNKNRAASRFLNNSLLFRYWLDKINACFARFFDTTRVQEFVL